jgi:hypothetical protein
MYSEGIETLNADLIKHGASGNKKLNSKTRSRIFKYGKKTIKILVIRQFIYRVTENGLLAATEESLRDAFFIDEINAGNAWANQKAFGEFYNLSLESRMNKALQKE